MTCFTETFSEEMLVDLVSISKDAMIALDEDLSIIFWNRGAEEIFGYRAEEIIGKNLSILIPEDVDVDMELIKKIFWRKKGLPKMWRQYALQRMEEGSGCK